MASELVECVSMLSVQVLGHDAKITFNRFDVSAATESKFKMFYTLWRMDPMQEPTPLLANEEKYEQKNEMK